MTGPKTPKLRTISSDASGGGSGWSKETGRRRNCLPMLPSSRKRGWLQLASVRHTTGADGPRRCASMHFNVDLETGVVFAQGLRL